MARYGPGVMQVKVTAASTTGSFIDISQQVYDFSGWNVEAILEQSNTFGDTWEEFQSIGVSRVPAITIKGPWDDNTATGTAGLFGNTTDLGAERVMKLNWYGTTNPGQALNAKVDFIVQSYKRLPARGALTQYELVAQPTGAVTYVTAS